MTKFDACQEFKRLLDIVKTLRSLNGCQWDKAQSHQSLVPYMLEETYEVIESINEKNLPKLKEELGDLLLHIVFQCDIGEEEKSFTIADSIHSINEKLIRRHPHVFGNVKVNSIREIKENWEEIKLKEGRISQMEGIPKTLPALLQAQRVQLRATEVGFDWEKIENVWEKICEESQELKEAIKTHDKEKIKSEFGDLLFTLVNISRFLDINAEEALRGSVKKFIKRFKSIEMELSERGIKLKDSSLSDMNDIWNKIKSKENS